MDTQLREREYLKDRDNALLHQRRYTHFKPISWSAVLTGALIGIGISFIFNLFAMSIGLTAFVTTSANPKTIAIGGLIGLLLISIFSMGTAGWVAGYLGRPRSLHRDMGVIYGFTAWCLALVIMVLLAASFDKFITYNLAALQNPGYVLTNVNNNIQNTTNAGLTNTAASNTSTLQRFANNPNANNQNAVNTQDETKGLALTTFLAFVLAFIGGLSSCIGGHWGFRSSEKDTLYYRDTETRI